MKAGPHSSLTIEALRGAAALCVCWSHWGPAIGDTDLLWLTGRAGVMLFFIISGYVMPLSLARNDYHLSAVHRFLGRRIVRLYPGLLATVALILLLTAVKLQVGKPTPGYPGWPSLLGNLVLTPAAFGQAYLVPVFWTLTVEWQYYVGLALAYPLLASPHPAHRWFVLAVCVLAPHLPGASLAVLPWLPCFAVGIALWLRRAGQLTTPATAVVLGASVSSHVLLHGWASAVACGASAALLLLPWQRPAWARVAMISGAISYPLYLCHQPVGAEFSTRLWHWLGDSPLSAWAQAVAIVAATLGTAWLGYLALDRRAIRWSSRIRLAPRAPAALSPSPVL